MFNKSREYARIKRLQKKQASGIGEKRIENEIRLELRDLLKTNLLTKDLIALEISPKQTSVFLAIINEPEFVDNYTWEQVGETLYTFKAKEISW